MSAEEKQDLTPEAKLDTVRQMGTMTVDTAQAQMVRDRQPRLPGADHGHVHIIHAG